MNRAFVLLLPAAFAALSCARPTPMPAPGPAQALMRYAQDLRAGDATRAHQMLAAPVREAISADDLRRFLDTGGEQLRQVLGALAAADASVRLGATIRLADGREIVLCQEPDGWRLAAGPVVPVLGFTPEAAVEQFLRAIESRDCEALLACAPPRVLGAVERNRLLEGCEGKIEVLSETARQLRKIGSNPVRTGAGRAELTYQNHLKLVVVEHEGRWYIEDL